MFSVETRRRSKLVHTFNGTAVHKMKCIQQKPVNSNGRRAGVWLEQGSCESCVTSSLLTADSATHHTEVLLAPERRSVKYV